MAWILWAVTFGLWLVVVGMIALHPYVPRDAPFLLPRIMGSVLVLSTATVGALVASRRPGNPIGWIFCGVALVWDIGSAATEYAIYALLEHPGTLPAGDLAAWLSAWVLTPSALCLVFVMLLFPHGRLPSRRWRPVAWVAVAGIVLGTAGIAFTPGPLSTTIFAGPRNPFGITAMPWIHDAVTVVILVLCTSVLAVAGSLVARLRQARGVERQQLKWFLFGAIVVPSVAACVWLPMWLSGAPLSTGFGQVLAAVGVLTLTIVPVTTGIAVLRFRLYDIDVIINQTLVYGTVTALLAGLFATLSILTQRVVLGVTGQESQAAVVLAALVVTALFQPLRSRVQIVIDRRFYRRKYDATRTLERFSTRVRDEVELDRLVEGLTAVIDDTMQPRHISVWLRQPPGGGTVHEPVSR